jgi:hypothetical protein
MAELNITAIALSADATEEEFAQFIVEVRQQVKRWQANHRGSLLGENVSYGIKAACNMAYAGESLGDSISEVIVEKCAL